MGYASYQRVGIIKSQLQLLFQKEPDPEKLKKYLIEVSDEVDALVCAASNLIVEATGDETQREYNSRPGYCSSCGAGPGNLQSNGGSCPFCSGEAQVATLRERPDKPAKRPLDHLFSQRSVRAAVKEIREMSRVCTYHIIFPKGDRSKLKVIELSATAKHELSDYSVASRREFYTSAEAAQYAQELAHKHNLQYVGDDEGYLD